MKCFRPTCIVKHMGNHGIDIVLYLDDGFGFGQDFYTCLKNLNFVRDTLIKAVCIINFEKPILQPVQCRQINRKDESFYRIFNQQISSFFTARENGQSIRQYNI